MPLLAEYRHDEDSPVMQGSLSEIAMQIAGVSGESGVGGADPMRLQFSALVNRADSKRGGYVIATDERGAVIWAHPKERRGDGDADQDTP